MVSWLTLIDPCHIQIQNIDAIYKYKIQMPFTRLNFWGKWSKCTIHPQHGILFYGFMVDSNWPMPYKNTKYRCPLLDYIVREMQQVHRIFMHTDYPKIKQMHPNCHYVTHCRGLSAPIIAQTSPVLNDQIFGLAQNSFDHHRIFKATITP